jgi:hypothetical protein
LPVTNNINSKNIKENPQFVEKILQIINQTEKMYQETGRYIDWFGFNKMDEIIKLLTIPDYWSIPNLVIINEKQLNIFDLGLYQDNNIMKDKKHFAVSPLVDPLVCKLQLYLIGKIKEKLHVQIS